MDHAATTEIISKWEYLDKMVNQMNQTTDETVGLLVGANCKSTGV